MNTRYTRKQIIINFRITSPGRRCGSAAEGESEVRQQVPPASYPALSPVALGLLDTSHLDNQTICSREGTLKRIKISEPQWNAEEGCDRRDYSDMKMILEEDRAHSYFKLLYMTGEATVSGKHRRPGTTIATRLPRGFFYSFSRRRRLSTSDVT